MRKFTSSLASEFVALIEYKRSLGFTYSKRDNILASFDRYLVRSRFKKSGDLEQAALDWLKSRPTRAPQTVAGDLAVLRGLFSFLRRRQPRRYHADLNLPSNPPARKFTPFIFSKDQIRSFVEIAKGLHPPEYRSALFPSLVLLLYGTGIRFGEALRLRMRDVDLGSEFSSSANRRDGLDGCRFMNHCRSRSRDTSDSASG